VLGSDGAGAPLWPVMDDTERAGWEHSLDVLREAGKVLPIPV
jgi:hypothetical protein